MTDELSPPEETPLKTVRYLLPAVILPVLLAGFKLSTLAQEPQAAARREQGAEEARPTDPLSPQSLTGLRLRGIGPALTSGRVVDLAVHPADHHHYYVAAASGGVWKTINSGTTWTPVFDAQGSYSIGCLALDPKDPSVVWVGTGENNSQRSVSYGDGVYKSVDGGKSWRKVGLEKSEHIGRILIDPRNSDVVYVAAQGPLWGPGGDRGLYKSGDGGKTWKNILQISENTGVTDLAIDHQNPDILYAASWQRRRHVFTLINGGPESAIYKSTDAGATWNKLRSGLPNGDLGRIGLAVSPVDPNVVYATIEATGNLSGIFRSSDKGATWVRMNPSIAQGMYYGQIICDPKDVDRIYVPNVIMMVSDDGGRTLRPLGERSKHVDNHAIWINPNNTNHYLVGCDGGVYESFDRGQYWHFKANLPIAQFYDVTVDQAAPFYHVYGGTQDNFSLGGPSRTRNASGIANSDWFVTNGGDGFHSRVDPEDPNIVYATLQYGGLVRYDKRTGERIGIKPQDAKGEPPLRWNWDSPLIISPHAPTRLYFAANKLFRSDDRGHTWKAISPDLTRQIDRDTLPVMGKVWGPDAVGKNQSTSFYGNIVALSESPKKEGLIYVGTDDGLIQVTDNGGGSWRRVEAFPGVPGNTFVSRLFASQHDPNTVYALFNNHKNADFKPYACRSTDAGRTWTSIAGTLPPNGPLWAIIEDHLNPKLLFIGNEFGLHFSIDGGGKWTQLKGGLPTIAVRDLAIQKRENDLVVGTFGRGIYILDDYTPLRTLSVNLLAQQAHLFPVKDALLYIQSQPYGGRGKAFLGESFYTADNPPFGAVFTYYLKEPLRTKRQLREERERKGNAPYPSKDELRAEEEEEPPSVLLTVSDSSGRVIRRVNGPTTAGLHRIAWDLRYPGATLAPPRQGGGSEDVTLGEPPSGPLVMPGRYTVSLSKRVGGAWTQLAGPQSFNVEVEGAGAMSAADRAALAEFQQKVSRLQRAVAGATQSAVELKNRLGLIRRALIESPAATEKMIDEAAELDRKTNELLRALRGDPILAARNYNLPPSINSRVNTIVNEHRMSTARPTTTQAQSYAIAAGDFEVELKRLRALIEIDLAKLERSMETVGAPWTPGRIPVWQDK
jgi:photosystem II stability/assembly factor-like uncharacterized protein